MVAVYGKCSLPFVPVKLNKTGTWYSNEYFESNAGF